MAEIAPNERNVVFDLIEEDDTVAACDPLDVREIIADAQAKTADTPRIVTVRKRKQDKPKQSIATCSRGEIDENISEETDSNFASDQLAPPPYKKRLLVQSTS